MKKISLLLLLTFGLACKSTAQRPLTLAEQQEQRTIKSAERMYELLKPGYDSADFVVIAFVFDFDYIYNEKEDQTYLIHSLKVNKLIKSNTGNFVDTFKVYIKYEEKGKMEFDRVQFNPGARERLYFLKQTTDGNGNIVYETLKRSIFINVEIQEVFPFLASVYIDNYYRKIISKEVFYKGLNLVIGKELNYEINPIEDWVEFRKRYKKS